MNKTTRHQRPTQEEIAICAWLIWKQEGCPEHLDKVHWHQAETQLTLSRAHERWMSGQRVL